MSNNFAHDTTAILSALNIPAEYAALGLRIAGTAPNSRGWLSCHAIDREDNTPSAAINVNTGRYVDLGATSTASSSPGSIAISSQSRSLSLWDFAAAHGTFLDWQDARRHYAEKANVKLGKSRAPSDTESAQKKDPASQLDFLPWSDATAHLWCSHKPGATVESCRAAGARIAWYPKSRKSGRVKVIAFPCYGRELAEADPVGWVVFHSGGLGLTVWRKQRDGKLKPESLPPGKSKTVHGSQAGLMNLHGVIRLQTAGADEIKCVLKTEGVSDMLSLWAAIPPNARDAFPVVTNAGGTAQELPQDIIIAAFAGRVVANLHDADNPGRIGSMKFCRQMERVAKSVRDVVLPYPIAEKKGPDVRQWLFDRFVEPRKQINGVFEDAGYVSARMIAGTRATTEAEAETKTETKTGTVTVTENTQTRGLFDDSATQRQQQQQQWQFQ